MSKTNQQTVENPDNFLESIETLSEPLQQIANCLGFLIIQMSEYKDKSKTDRIPFLNSLGFDRNNIAAILDTTPNTVSVRLSQRRATKKEKK